MTFKEFKNNPEKAISELGSIIYCHKPYVLLKDGVIMDAGDADHFTGSGGSMNRFMFSSDYYDNLDFELRQHDLHMNDNTKATLPVFI